MGADAGGLQLPEGFAELERFVSDWALGSEQERNHKRLTSSMEELQIFYDAMLLSMEAIVTHLTRFRLVDLPLPEQRLLALTLSLMEVAPAVEVYGTPDVPNAIAASRFLIRSP
ncbi:MAG: hypothetical protein FJ147_21705 [Deltaproteobacteria bacterium]|nr:hypothetical protein [Deltaproteobacteria bacterium]